MSVLSKNRSPLHRSSHSTTKPPSSPFKSQTPQQGSLFLLFASLTPTQLHLSFNGHINHIISSCWMQMFAGVTGPRLESSAGHPGQCVPQVHLPSQPHLSALSVALCPFPASDRGPLLSCFSTTILRMQMSSEMPLPLGNHPLSHNMSSSFFFQRTYLHL